MFLGAVSARPFRFFDVISLYYDKYNICSFLFLFPRFFNFFWDKKKGFCATQIHGPVDTLNKRLYDFVSFWLKVGGRLKHQQKKSADSNNQLSESARF